jgi:hypothetical protein
MESKNLKIRIIYESVEKENGKFNTVLKDALLPFDDLYDERNSLKDNMENWVIGILDDGFVWVDNKTLIPLSSIKQIMAPRKKR